jgi:hypothetical protein
VGLFQRDVADRSGVPLPDVEEYVKGAGPGQLTEIISDFALALLVDYGLAVGTTVGYLRLVGRAVEAWGGPANLHLRANNRHLKKVLDMANKSPAANPHQAAPWSADLSDLARSYARTTHAMAKFKNPESFADLVDLGFFFLLRVSEVAATGNAAGAGPLLARDVCFGWQRDGGGWLISESPDAGPDEFPDVVILRIKGSKNDGSAAGAVRCHHRTRQAGPCPVAAAARARRRIPAGHLPLFPDTTGENVTKFIRFVARHAGINSSIFSSHSLRRGGTTALVARGKMDLAFELGRWKNPLSMNSYIVPGIEKAVGLSSAMLSRLSMVRC